MVKRVLTVRIVRKIVNLKMKELTRVKLLMKSVKKVLLIASPF